MWSSTLQQEITKGLTSPLARAIQQLKKKQGDLQKEKLEMMGKLGDQLNRVEGVEDLSKRGVNTGKRVVEIIKEEESTKKELETAQSQYKAAQEARRNITHAYHPFNLNTGEKQAPEDVKKSLEGSYEVLETVADDADCTDKQKQKIEKSKGLIGSMIEVLIFFFSFMALTIKTLGLDESSGKLFEKLVSIEYLKLCFQRTKKKEQKENIKATLQRLENELENDPLWRQIPHTVQKSWRSKALECAQVFQRSSVSLF